MRGFSLVELSIVLVILGLLTGGILAGRSLIRASELRAVSTEHSRWITATRAFQDKYLGLPGDLTNATGFWGKDATNCNSHTGTAATNGVCNGNGNGLLQIAGSPASWGEQLQYWRHLAAAGLIEGTYTGLAGSGANNEALLGVNSPISKLSSAGWGVWQSSDHAGSSNAFAYQYGNTLVFGAQNPANPPHAAILKPEEAWNIDTKLDDGKPATGKLMAYRRGTCTNSTSATDTASDYLLTSDTIGCALFFPKVF